MNRSDMRCLSLCASVDALEWHAPKRPHWLDNIPWRSWRYCEGSQPTSGEEPLSYSATPLQQFSGPHPSPFPPARRRSRCPLYSPEVFAGSLAQVGVDVEPPAPRTALGLNVERASLRRGKWQVVHSPSFKVQEILTNACLGQGTRRICLALTLAFLFPFKLIIKVY